MNGYRVVVTGGSFGSLGTVRIIDLGQIAIRVLYSPLAKVISEPLLVRNELVVINEAVPAIESNKIKISVHLRVIRFFVPDELKDRDRYPRKSCGSPPMSMFVQSASKILEL